MATVHGQESESQAEEEEEEEEEVVVGTLSARVGYRMTSRRQRGSSRKSRESGLAKKRMADVGGVGGAARKAGRHSGDVRVRGLDRVGVLVCIRVCSRPPA